MCSPAPYLPSAAIIDIIRGYHVLWNNSNTKKITKGSKYTGDKYYK